MKRELIVDSFAGAGGASLGIQLGCGHAPDIAINHDAAALLMHAANHPETLHVEEDVWKADLRALTGGCPVWLLWLSPDCKHFSRAKGAKPVEKRIRSLAWIACRWAKQVQPRVIILENVREFCFPENTAVLTKRGVIPIVEVKLGDEVWTHNARWKPVTNINRSLKSTVRVKGYGNSIIETTPNHKFYAREVAPLITKSGKRGRHVSRLLEPQWVRADELARFDVSSTYTKNYSGYAWASPTEMPKYWMRLPEALGVDCNNPAFFYMLGRWLGDGWIRKRKGRDNQDLVRICDLIQDCDELDEKLNQTGLRWTRSNHSESVDVFDLDVASSRILIPWLIRHFNQYSHLKTLPAWIYGASPEQRWALIDGYSDADGHVFQENEIHFVSVSRCLSVGMKLLLQSLGVSASISRRDACELPAVGNPEKIMQCRESYSVSWRREVGFEKCHRGDLHIWGRVRSCEQFRDDVPVVDITVEGDHSFIADGQVVHNCDWGPVVPRHSCGNCGWRGTEGTARLVRTRRRCPVCDSLRLTVSRDMVPCPHQKGVTFRRFVGRLRGLGYRVEWKNLNAADYGAPTHRRRLFLVARMDDREIRWPDPTHGKPGELEGDLFSTRKKPWRTAAECIEWDVECPSIFERKRPLAEKTLRRIAHGIKRYVLDNPNPFIVPLTHCGSRRNHSLEEPLPTITGAHRGELALVTPVISQLAHGEGKHGRWGMGSNPVTAPIGTIHAGGGNYALVAPTLIASGYSERSGQSPRSMSTEAPLGTCVGTVKHGLVQAFIEKHLGGTGELSIGSAVSRNSKVGTANNLAAVNLVHMNHGDKQWSGLDEPMRTLTTARHAALVYAFMVRFFGQSIAASVNEPKPSSCTMNKDGLVVVRIEGEPFVVTDIGMRMLTPRELARAQGFPDSYVLTGTKTNQIARVGNSVCPDVASAIVRANYGSAAIE